MQGEISLLDMQVNKRDRYVAHELPELPFDYEALEPHIDAETLKVHHTGHHKTYVNKLNDILKSYPDLSQLSIEELLGSLKDLPYKIREDVRHNGGGHFNHTLLWKILTPETGTKPSSTFENALNKKFGNIDKFKDKFSREAQELFGSGYVCLCTDKSGLLIKSMPNQDSPLMKGMEPIFLMDLWEHAYYLKHQNRRDESIEAFWNVVNWEEVSKLFETSIQTFQAQAA